MVIKYKNGFYLFRQELGDKPLQSIAKHELPDLKLSRFNHVWNCSASLINTAYLVSNYRSSFSKDEATQSYIAKMIQLGLRLAQLQRGISKEDRDIDLPNTIDYVLTPYAHQKEAIAFALNLNKSALFLDLGLGKTFTSITVAKLRHASDHVHKVLCIVPRSLIAQWCGEIKRFAPYAKIYTIVGVPKAKNSILANLRYRSDELSFTLVTYESVGSVFEPMLEAKFDMFILDESAKIKNPKAVRTKNTIEICKTIRYGILLTGLPYTNSPLDMYSQMLAVDPSIYGSSQWDFSNRYIKYQTMGCKRYPVGVQHIDELKARAYYAAFSRTKEQCLDLPAKVYQKRTLPMYEEQYNWYIHLLNKIYGAEKSIEEILADKDAEKSELVTIEYVVSLLEKLQQVTSGFVKTDTGEFIWFDSPKYGEARSIIRESNDVFIVWAKHTATIKKLYSMFYAIKEWTVEVLTNKATDEQRLSIKKRFNEGKIKVLILQIQSECRGNDFTCKNNAVSSIFFENTSSIEERLQAESRQHRIGMKGTAVYIDLVCEDTYDEGILELLKHKEKLSSYIREQKLNLLLGKGGTYTAKKATNLKTASKHIKTPKQVAEEEAAYIDMYANRPEGMMI